MYLNAFYYSILSIFFTVPVSNSLTGTFSIDPGSKLYLEGTSNVADFSCDCKQTFSDIRFEYTVCENSEISFSRTVLKIKSEQLDCGHAGMNRDMQETLNAEEYPEILIELIKLTLPDQSIAQRGYSTDLSAMVALTISGVRQIVHLSVEIKALGFGQYQIKSWHPVFLSEFGLSPPSPLLGLVKVSNTINIFFDLQAQLKLQN